MKILTLTQPWATLVALGAKHIETRSWATSYRGPLAIHAGAGLRPVGGRIGLWRQCARQPFFRALEPHFRVTHLNMGADLGFTDCIDVSEMPLGTIVAVAFLAGCEPTDRVDADGHGMATWPRGNSYVTSVWPLTDQERAFGDYSPGRYAWLLGAVRPLREPLPYRGAQGLRTLPADVITLVEALAVSSAPPAR